MNPDILSQPIKSKVLEFPGDKSNPSPGFSLVLTPKILGKGQYGLVHYAYSTQDNTDFYAAKVIDRKKIVSARMEKHLKNEIAIMAEIKSPNVVKLKDATQTANNFYLAMELCNGGDLANFVKTRGGFLKEPEVKVLFKQIVSGLTAIKQKLVMHRDLKPANIMINFPELPTNACLDTYKVSQYMREVEITEQKVQCKIADLGFARKLGVGEVAGTNSGTPLYMAPEVLKQEDYDHSADVWAVGCIFYEMLCGFPPFHGKNIPELNNKIMQGKYSIPKTIKLSIECVELMNKMLQFSRHDRISWIELKNSPYVTIINDLGNKPDELFMSFCQKTQNLQHVKQDKSIDHQKVIQAPYRWMDQNPDKALTMNTKNDIIMQDAIQKRYMMYQERLQKEEDEVVEPILNESRILRNLQDDLPNRNTEIDDAIMKMQMDALCNQPNDYKQPTKKFEIKKQISVYQQEEEEKKDPIMSQSQFFDVMKESQFDHVVGKRKFITKNLNMPNVPVSASCFRVNKNFF